MKLNLEWYRGKTETRVDSKTGEKFTRKVFKEFRNGNLSTFKYINGGVDFTDSRTRLGKCLTLDQEGNIVTLGFPKFFVNHQLDNRDSVSEDFKERFSRLQDREYYVAYHKFDGICVVLSTYEGEFVVSTSGGTGGPNAKAAKEFFDELPNKKEIFDYLEGGKCFVFEFVSKSNTIVVPYERDEYFLLGETDKNTLEYILYGEMVNRFGFKGPTTTIYFPSQLDDLKERGAGIEGIVIRNDYGNLIKVKTNWWYFMRWAPKGLLDRDGITKKNIKDVVLAILKDQVDDLQALENTYPEFKRRGKVTKICKAFAAAEAMLELHPEEAMLAPGGKFLLEHLETRRGAGFDYTKGRVISNLIEFVNEQLAAQDARDTI